MSDATLLDGVATSAFLAGVERHMVELVETRTGVVTAAALDPIRAGGKRLRPLLVRAARPAALIDDDLQARAFESGSIRAAAAVELVHTASLVHDDLLDDAQLRRGEPTVGASSGRAVATAAGDLLFSLAFDTLVQCRETTDATRVLRAVRVLARASRTLAEGEALQARQQRDPWLAESAYLERCEMKTGVLFEAALQLGAILGGAELDDVDVLGRFGRMVGTAFQLADDVLDCGAPETESTLGKRPGADVRDGTMTMPMLRAVQHDPELADALARQVDPDRVERLLARIRATGAVESSRARAHALRGEAEQLLDALGDRFDRPALTRVAAASVDRIA
jgi:geranylgeranyl pyrophosphate synthase